MLDVNAEHGAVTDQEADLPLGKERPRLRACWLTHLPSGLLLQAAMWTRRVRWSMNEASRASSPSGEGGEYSDR
jgi:hypothetical protein